MARLLKERYKTIEGAHKRAAFENALAFGEFRRSAYEAKLYRYRVVRFDNDYRVERVLNQKETGKMFTLKISTANESFDDREAHEIADILERVASVLRSYPLARGAVTIGQPIRDTNGNTVGKWELK